MNNSLHRRSTTKHATQTTLLVSACMFILACLATYPLVINLDNALIGHPKGDSFEMMWLIWWLKKAAFNPDLSAATIPFLFHPHGLTLPLINTQIGAHILALPFAAAFGAVPAYNITMIMSLALSGVTAYFLGLNLTGNKLASVAVSYTHLTLPTKA